MNTARSFGPAAVTGFPNNDHWIVRIFSPMQTLALAYVRYPWTVLGWPVYGLSHRDRDLLASETVRERTSPNHCPNRRPFNSARYTHLNAGQDTTDPEKSPRFGAPAVVVGNGSGDADHIASLQK
jgi:hypothetical protein